MPANKVGRLRRIVSKSGSLSAMIRKSATGMKACSANWHQESQASYLREDAAGGRDRKHER